jgi:hypothetical protein
MTARDRHVVITDCGKLKRVTYLVSQVHTMYNTKRSTGSKSENRPPRHRNRVVIIVNLFIFVRKEYFLLNKKHWERTKTALLLPHNVRFGYTLTNYFYFMNSLLTHSGRGHLNCLNARSRVF